jgi:hypothetical protein
MNAIQVPPSAAGDGSNFSRAAGGDQFYGRTPDQDLELWKHYAAFGGEDKNRMVAIASWLLGFSAAILSYIVSTLLGTHDVVPIRPLQAAMASAIGVGASGIAAYVAVLYGGYSNQNWQRADEIAAARGWNDLLPGHPFKLPSTRRANYVALRWARPCDPTKEQAPVFLVFLALSGFLFLVHGVILGLSLMALG